MGMRGLGESLEEVRGNRLSADCGGVDIRMPLVARERSLGLSGNWRRLACRCLVKPSRLQVRRVGNCSYDGEK